MKEALIPFHGESMSPLFKPGDELLVQIFTDAPSSPYSRGNILVFRDGEALTAHRLLKKSDHHLILKGDKSYQVDLISPQKVIGKVVGFKDAKGIHKWPEGRHLAQNTATHLSEYSLLFPYEKASRFNPLRLACLTMLRTLLVLSRYFIASSKT